ncbi:DUF3152 domain-containing protein [Streptomyces sp. E11-3]
MPADSTPPRGFRPAPGAPGASRGPSVPPGTPAHGVPRVPGQGAPGFPQRGTPAHGTPGFPQQGTPAHGTPGFSHPGTPARGVPQARPGAAGPAQGTPRQGTPGQGVPQYGTPAHGVAQVRGGHPEQREAGGGWGAVGRAPVAAGPGAARPRIPGPRQEYLAAFDGGPATADPADDVFAAGAPRRGGRDPYATVTAWDYGVPSPDETDADADDPGGPDGPDGAPSADDPASPRGGKGRAFTGIAAAAVTTVLAVVVAGQVADGPSGDTRTQAADADSRGRDDDSASRSDDRPTPADPTADPSPSESAPATYAQKMGEKNPFDPELKGGGEFEAIGGLDKAPGKGQKFRYRVDVEKGIGLDGELFAEAVQKTLNDDRSWSHGGGRTFERISSGQPDFVITLASPGTTGVWCAKSGLDTTQQNVSCDSAATERIMINGYRWAQGAKTYGDEIHAYRQMLINHEVGHRLGFGHVNCSRDGGLAPVMQQQTKFLERDGISCKANPWAFPGR